MKKLILAGIAVLLVMFSVTCDLGPQGGDDVVEYTDVEYSEDGSFVTVYLDGSKPVPVTRSQRAITTNLAKMAYDYIEVLFISTTGGAQVRARSVWELGQAAGISGVDRGVAGGKGIDYLWHETDGGTGILTDTVGTDDAATSSALALMFVGRKDNKTLLGVGRILQVDRTPKIKKDTFYDASVLSGAVTGLPVLDSPATIAGYAGTFTTTAGVTTFDNNGYLALIKEDTTSVTFWIEAVKTGLLIKDETVFVNVTTPPATMNKLEIAFDSFQADTAGLASDIRTKATRSPINNSRASYPLYPLPEPKATDTKDSLKAAPTTATYTFGGGAKTFVKHIKFDEDSSAVAEKRFPRYMDGGRYLAPQSNVDTETKVEIAAAYSAADYSNIVPLEFTLAPLSYGLFSFYIEIPVYLFLRTDPADEDNTKPTNGGPDAVMWKIRTGLGSELYSLDDGRSSGGCVLMGVGVSALDWLEIYWNFID